MRAAYAGTFLTLIFVMGGCATLLDGEDQDLTFHSNPEGAEVTVAGQVVGETPANVSLTRANEAIEVTFEADGHRTYRTTIQSDINTAFFGNIISGGTFGSSTDFATGAMWEYQPGTYRAELAPEGEQAREQWLQEMKVVQLAMNHYPDLVADLEAGEGEHLEAILTHIERGDFGVDLGTEDLREMRLSSQHSGAFADQFLAAVRE